LSGILNCTPSYNKLIINFDLNKTNTSKIFDFLKSVDFSKLNLSENKKEWIIPICYDFEMDLKNMSKVLKIDKEEIINIHLNTDFFIYMIGFVPGHPFMGDLDSKLFLNRLTTPRVKIPAGSVGIVEKFCNIYPYESPGGWNIIGKTPKKVFNKKDSTNPCLLSPGDTVKFKSISKKEFEKLSNE
jgi:KipI family sensor histidine kinase inhibitor